MTLSFDYKSLEFVLFDSAVAFVLPKPFYVGSRKELQNQPWLLRIGLSVYNYLVRRDVKIKGVIFAQKVCFKKPSLEFADGVVDAHISA
jgi:hypothetical protein